MPLPFILAGWAIATVATGGVAGGGIGVAKMWGAKRDVAEKQAELALAEQATADAQTACETAFTDLGEAKVRAIEHALLPFHDAFARLKHVDLEADVRADDAPEFDAVTVREAGRLTVDLASLLGITAVGAGAGTLASMGTTAAVTSLAAASTGTAISSLSGVAATNATLAWLGGGSLAAGGGGVAAGTVMLTGIAAAPVLLVGGVFLYQKGREAQAKSAEFAADVDTALAQHHASIAVLHAATECATHIRRLLADLQVALAGRAGWLSAIVDAESDWRRLDDATRERIRGTVALAMGTSALVHTPIMSDDGTITRAIRRAADQGATVLGDASV